MGTAPHLKGMDMSGTRLRVIIGVLCALIVGCGAGALGSAVADRYREEQSPDSNPAGTAVGFAHDLASPATQTRAGVDVDERWIAPGTGWDPTSRQAVEFANTLWRSSVADDHGNYYDNGGFLAAVDWGPNPVTNTVGLYSRVSGKPIMTVVTVLVDGRGFMVDWHATVEANKSPLDPLRVR